MLSDPDVIGVFKHCFTASWAQVVQQGAYAAARECESASSLLSPSPSPSELPGSIDGKGRTLLFQCLYVYMMHQMHLLT